MTNKLNQEAFQAAIVAADYNESTDFIERVIKAYLSALPPPLNGDIIERIARGIDPFAFTCKDNNDELFPNGSLVLPRVDAALKQAQAALAASGLLEKANQLDIFKKKFEGVYIKTGGAPFLYEWANIEQDKPTTKSEVWDE